jgi:uncharacterized protein
VNGLSEKEIEEILQQYKVIAVVGLSRDKDKPSYRVAQYMKQNGYRIIPVNPFVDEVLGEKSYKNLLEIPADLQKTIEVVDVFRRAEDVPSVVEQAIQMKKANGKPYVVWIQQGIVNEDAAKAASKAELIVIMDKCIMIEHNRLC